MIQLISRKTILAFFLPGALFMGLFMIYPIFKMGLDSLFNFNPNGLREFVGFDNYIKAFTNESFLQPLKNTLFYVVIAVVVELILGTVLALVFEANFKGNKTIRSLILTPLMIAPLVAGLIWKLMLSSQFGIINQLLVNVGILKNTSQILWLADEKWALLSCTLADIWLTTPFMMLMILAGLQGLDGAMLEAATIDGATWWQKIFSIKLPNIKPILLTALSIRIIDAARTFDIVWAMTQGGPNGSSELISVVIYKTLTRYNKVGYASAMALILIVVLVIFTLVAMQGLWNPKKKQTV
ncbi:MAG: sugar ABC transporter permease [Lactococcus chungangensis]|nr:sugar ABC transporter permease [Lactococcus chungangensis]